MVNKLKVITAILKSMRAATGSHWSAAKTGVTRSRFEVVMTVRATANIAYEPYELDSAVNYLVQTWTGEWQNLKCKMRNPTSSSLPFWLVFLTGHKMLYHSAPNMVCRCRVERHCTRLADSLQHTVDASKFPLVRKFTKQLSCTTLFDRRKFKNRIASLWDFHDYI